MQFKENANVYTLDNEKVGEVERKDYSEREKGCAYDLD